MRPFAVGRKNWMSTGTPDSANKAALLYNLIQTCKMNGILLIHQENLKMAKVQPTMPHKMIKLNPDT